MRVVTLLALLAVAPCAAAQTTGDTLVADVRTLSAATDNDARFEALTTLLTAQGLPFTVETFTRDKPPAASANGARDPRTRGRNVVVTIGRGRETVVVGAHYDAEWIDEKTLSKGAIDNGASSVMLVHAAAALRNQRLKSRVTFVWFDFEESGLLGSARYVDAHASATITATFDPSQLGVGDHAATLCVDSNDPARPHLAIPVRFHVDDVLFADGFDPAE